MYLQSTAPSGSRGDNLAEAKEGGRGTSNVRRKCWQCNMRIALYACLDITFPYSLSVTYGKPSHLSRSAEILHMRFLGINYSVG